MRERERERELALLDLASVDTSVFVHRMYATSDYF